MGYFKIEATGAQASGLIEKIVSTARDAEFERNALQRLCGKYGKVDVSGKDGRAISPDTLRRLAQDEENANAQRT